jgi:ABC-type nitrate/sulfonate/bicarbonate transport system substrate-binding protein
MKVSAGLGLLGAGGGSLLSACSSSTKSTVTKPSGGGTKSLGSAALQLSWIENVEFAGSYVAKSKGHYSAQGLDVTLLAGGPSVAVEPLLVAGKALVGKGNTAVSVAAIKNGAPLKIIGAGFQRNPFALMSLAARPIKTPADMIGKKIGVQADNQSPWNAFLKINGLDASKIDVVPVQFDPSPLAGGQVDGWFSFFTNEPNVLKAKGIDTYTFLLDSYGYHLIDNVYMATTANLADPKKRGQIVALMKGEVLGWQEVLADPSEGTRLTVDVYGKDLGLSFDEQMLEAKAQNDLVSSPTTQAHGLFWMSDADQANAAATLAVAGVKFQPSDVFTNEILQDVFQGKASL